MKNFKVLSTFLLMLFVSSIAIGQTTPLTTFVQDTPELFKHFSGSEVVVNVEWFGVTGSVKRTVTTTVAGITAGIDVIQIFNSSNFSLPVTQTHIYVEFTKEIHSTKYRLYVPYAIRSIDPIPWLIEEK
ncbi:MAG: hypothetical protein LBP67_00155 [Bacteroidales bacterium]|jgi:hypothetical protein|nr:hypothetical protein [Bacteroidales bacterium]